MMTIKISSSEYKELRRSIRRAGTMIDLLWLSTDNQPSPELQHDALECAHEDHQIAMAILARFTP